MEARRIGEGMAAHDVNEALKAGEIEGNFNIGRDFQLQKIANNSGIGVRNVGAATTQMTTGTQIKEASLLNKKNVMGGAYEASDTKATMAAGSIRGWEISYEKAKHSKVKPFRGSKLDYQTFQESTHWESLYGQNVATHNAAKVYDESVPDFTAKQRTGDYMWKRAESGVEEKYIEQEGIPETTDAIMKGLYYRQGQNLSLAPTPSQAKNRGMWEGRLKYLDYRYTRDTVGTPQWLARWQAANKLADTVLARQIPQALLMKDNDARLKVVESNVANYLKHNREAGVYNEAALVTDAEMRYLNAAVSKDIKHGEEGMMMTQLKGNLGGHLEAGFELFGNGGKVTVEGNIGATNQIADKLSQATGVKVTSDVLRTQLMKKNMELAVANPEMALEKQKAFFNNLMSAVESGDIQKVAGMLNLKQASPTNLTQAHYKGSSPADQIQGIMDQAGGSIFAYGEELKDTMSKVGNDLYNGFTGIVNNGNQENFITNPAEAIGKANNSKMGISEKEAEKRDEEIYKVFLGE